MGLVVEETEFDLEFELFDLLLGFGLGGSTQCFEVLTMSDGFFADFLFSLLAASELGE